MASSTRAVSSARGALSPMERKLDPLELAEDIVGQVECAVRADVALDAAQDPEGCELLVGRRDLLRLPPERVGVETLDDRDVGRVIADSEVVVASFSRRLAHLED